jgi:ABC-type polar amino acid transport system ATPase subunit
MTEPVVELINVRKSFGDHEVLCGINVAVRKGGVLVLIGPSGSGKSTMLRCVNFLERPTSGTVRVLGQDLRARGVKLTHVRRNVGMVFQHFNLFAHRSALGNVMEGPRVVLRLSRKESEARAMAMLEKVGVAQHAHKKPHRLSGGQRQRVAIARALALEPRVMLFDEPTSALDPELRAEVLDVMLQLASEGMTMMIATHEMNFARKVGDQIVFIDEGTIVEEGKPEVILQSPQSERLQRFLQTIFWGEEERSTAIAAAEPQE